MRDDDRIVAANDRYMRACHAMQSGVAAKMPLDPSETQAKHLRVGVNSALLNSAAIARLLIAKGVISEVEYFEAIADEAEKEAASYERWLSERLGREVTLG